MSPRTWHIGGAAAAVLVLVLAWLLLVSPTLQDAAALEEQTAAQEQASQELRSRISLLKKQSEELPAQEAALAQIQQRMPPTPALPTLIRNLTTVAKNADVTVASVTPGRPTVVQQPLGRTGSSSSSTPSTSSASTASAEGPSPASAVGIEQAGVQSMSVGIVACGSFAQLRKYLLELESMKRVMTVSAVSIARGSCAEGAADDDLTATIGAHVFTLPSSADADAATSSGQSSGTAGKGEGDE